MYRWPALPAAEAFSAGMINTYQQERVVGWEGGMPEIQPGEEGEDGQGNWAGWTGPGQALSTAAGSEGTMQ